MRGTAGVLPPTSSHRGALFKLQTFAGTRDENNVGVSLSAFV